MKNTIFTIRERVQEEERKREREVVIIAWAEKKEILLVAQATCLPRELVPYQNKPLGQGDVSK